MDYSSLCDERLIFSYLLKCRKGVHWKHSVQSYSLHALSNVRRLAQMMRSEKWSFPPYRCFTICERGKVRHIQAASIDERIIQKMLCHEYVVPLLTRSLIYDNGATIKGKGIAFSRRRIIRHLREYFSRFGRKGYVLQVDVRDYFGSISHDILLEKLLPKITDGKIRRLVEFFVHRNKTGLGLGSELSQILAVWFLSDMDHYCKEVLQCRYYARHVDDIYILHHSAVRLGFCLEKIKDMLAEHGLQINEGKTRILRIANGFTFLKCRYRFSPHGRILRLYGKESGRKMRRKLRAFAQKKADPVKVRNEYQSWRRSMKKFDADGVIKATDAAYAKYILGGSR